MFLPIVLAFAQAAPPPAFDEHWLLRGWLIARYAQAASLLEDMQTGAQRTLQQAAEPQTGMALRVMPLGGRPPWRAIVVAHVLGGSAADAAGIRQGDRIVMVGREWLDHEDARALALYLSEYPDLIPLVVQRGDRLLHFRIRRRVEPCIALGYELAGHAEYQRRIALLRGKLEEYRGTLPELQSKAALELAHGNLKLTLGVISTLLESQSVRLSVALTLSCDAGHGPRF